MRSTSKFLLVPIIIFGFGCSSSKKATAKAPPKMTYVTNLETVVAANCAPCHFPDKGGKKAPLNSFAAVSKNIDDMIARISLKPGERGFMPDRKPRLSDSTINLFKQWRADGMLEK